MSRLGTACLTAMLLATASENATAQIRIGVAGPMTGTLAPLGEQVRIGVLAVVATINDTGGVLGEEVVVEIVDDACAADRAAAAAAQLAAAGVVFVIGHVCSSAAIAAAEVYALGGIVQIAPGAPDPRFTEERPGVATFRLFGREDDQALTLAAFLISRPAAEAIAIIDDRSTYGRGIAGAVGEAIVNAGREPALTDFYNAGEADFPALVGDLRDAGIDTVFVGGYAADIAALQVELARQNFQPLVLGADALADPTFPEMAGAEANGTLFTFPPDPTQDEDAVGAIAAIEAAGGRAEGFALYAYAAVEVWRQAVDHTQTTEISVVAAEIGAELFDTALGTLGFNEIGEVTLAGWAVYEWSGGGYRLYAP